MKVSSALYRSLIESYVVSSIYRKSESNERSKENTKNDDEEDWELPLPK